MIRKKHSQAAMEFLMTYGWALLVVLIAISALAYFGVLNPSRFLPNRCQFGPGVACVDFMAKQPVGGDDGNITMLIRNPTNDLWRDVSMYITDCVREYGESAKHDGAKGYGYIIKEGEMVDSSDSIIRPGESALFEINCHTIMQPGSNFRSEVVLQWNTAIAQTIIPHTRRGQIIVGVN